MPFYVPGYRVFYSWNKFLVEVDAWGKPFLLDKEGIEQAIRNVRRERPHYRSAAAWKQALGLFEGAREALEREERKVRERSKEHGE